MANALDYVLLKVEKKPPGRYVVYEGIDYTNKFSAGTWGDAVITGISGASSGTAALAFADLTGITISSYEGTGDAPYIAGNSIVFPEGSYWDITLSDGTIIPDPNSGYNVAATGQNGSPTDFAKDVLSGGSMYFQENGYNRDISGNMIPASADDPTIDVLGNPIIYKPIVQGLNFADGIIDYNGVQTNDIFNKNSVQGNLSGLPAIWLSGTVWDYDVDPLMWEQQERTMEYIYSRLTNEYKNLVFTTEVTDISDTIVGIAREELFIAALSDEYASILNMINNDRTTIP